MSDYGCKQTFGGVGDYVRFTRESRHNWVTEFMSDDDPDQTPAFPTEVKHWSRNTQ